MHGDGLFAGPCLARHSANVFRLAESESGNLKEHTCVLVYCVRRAAYNIHNLLWWAKTPTQKFDMETTGNRCEHFEAHRLRKYLRALYEISLVGRGGEAKEKTKAFRSFSIQTLIYLDPCAYSLLCYGR